MSSPLFEIIDCLTYKKVRINFDDETMAKAYVPYEIDNALSMCDLLVPTVLKVSMLNLPKKQHEHMYQMVLPQRQFFFNWVKRKKTISMENRQYISDYYNCSIKSAEEYIHILSDAEMENIFNIYKCGKNGQRIKL